MASGKVGQNCKLLTDEPGVLLNGKILGLLIFLILLDKRLH